MGNKDFLLENIGSYISLNGEIISAPYYADDALDEYYWNNGVAYEVIRIVQGVPMFIEDHISRLNESLSKLKARTEIGISELLSPMNALLYANETTDCNVKICAATDAFGGINYFMNINKFFYPPPEYYRNGVPVGLYAHTRENPNVKQVVAGFKEKIQALIDSGGVFELLLYDGTNQLTEGSRSNVFFTRGYQLFTAPDRMILKGTIRKYVFLAAQRAGIEIIERPVTLEEFGLSPGSLDRRRVHGKTDSDRTKPDNHKIRHFIHRKNLVFPKFGPGQDIGPSSALPVLTVNGAFLTGTSIGVLPISRIGGVKLNSVRDKVIRAIMEKYKSIEREYINARLE